MLLQIFGLVSQPTWWHLNRIPIGGGSELATILAKTLPQGKNLEFYSDDGALQAQSADALAKLWSHGVGQIVAKPVDTAPRSQPDSKLTLITIAGPDAGRIFPLSRHNLSVGRGDSRAQIRDPWLSAHDFDIRLSSNGTVITPAGGPEFLWESGRPYMCGSSSFDLHRGIGQALRTPDHPGAFQINPGQPPSPPNAVLQVIGAAAPLMIGVVLMVMTGMWYFLLFSGISVIIAAVMIGQYRRARNRFIRKIRESMKATAGAFDRSVFAPHQLIRALSAVGPDPLKLQGPQPEHPVLYVGDGLRMAVMEQVHQTQRWDEYLTGSVGIVLALRPGYRTVVVGDPSSRRPVKNWCIAQLLRHARATATGIIVDDQHLGGGPVLVDVTDDELSNPAEHQHQIVFTDHTSVTADQQTTIIDLYSTTLEGHFSATALRMLGISSPTLEYVSDVIALDQPIDTLSMQHLSLSPATMQERAEDELITAVGAGGLGLAIDLVTHGPHLLITGTTGSGKSELLLTVLVGTIERYPPTEVSMILLDFKGGSSFNVMKPLPHTMSVETNHVAAASFRSLGAIAAELLRREHLFAAHGVADYQSFRRSYPNLVLPRLIVAIDELRVLVDENTEAAHTLARLAATGRSLGFHLIIATQRTQGAVSTDIRANIGSTISLRTATEHDSWEVLGTADAFRISTTYPGRAYFKSGADHPQLFQTSRYILEDEPIVVMPHGESASDKIKVITDWTRLVHELCLRAKHLSVPDPVILPELPEQVHRTALSTAHKIPSTYVAIGLVDNPATCSQYPVLLGPSSARKDVTILSGSVAWVGASGSGIDEAADVVRDHVSSMTQSTRVFLDGGQLAGAGTDWDQYLHVGDADPDVLKWLTQWLETIVAKQDHTTVVITDWGSWATQMVTGSFQGFEDLLVQLMRHYASVLTVYIFGARELAGGRMIAMISDRFYLPMNSSPEHRMIWPKLVAVPTVSSRAVLMTTDNPTGGLAVQLCTH